MWCIQISKQIFNIIIMFIEDIKYTTFFVSDNEEITRKIMDYLETLPNKSSIISSLTLEVVGFDLYQIDKYFQIVYIDDINKITQEKFPYDFICIEGIFNTFGKTIIQIQEHHNTKFNNIELKIIRNKLGICII